MCQYISHEIICCEEVVFDLGVNYVQFFTNCVNKISIKPRLVFWFSHHF